MKRVTIILLVFLLFSSCTARNEQKVRDNMLNNEYTNEYNKENLSVKESNLVMFQSKDAKTHIYILGTIHGQHYEKEYDYPIADIQSVIDTVKPDIILVEVRQETFDKFGALDGPDEMIFAWCYANEQGIPVKGIDWWQIREDTRAETTNAERDDHIFSNIISNIGNHKKVLVLCGATHRIEQSIRFRNNGYTEIKLRNIGSYFNNVSPWNFTYPKSMGIEEKKKSAYFQNEILNEILNGTLEGSEARKHWLQKLGLPDKN